MSLVVGTGGGGGFTLGPAQNVFTGANRTAAESARDTYQGNNANWLTSYNNDTNLNIRLEYTESGEQVALYQVRNTAGDDWLDNDSAQGVKGDPGIDGTILEFGSVAERDAFFSSRLNMLRANLPIMVTVAVETVSMQVWTGQTNPSSYSANLWRVASIRSGTASFELADVHTISSGGQNIFIINESSTRVFSGVYQLLGDHRESSDRTLVGDTPVARTYTPGNGVLPNALEPGGARATSGSVAFDVNFDIQGSNTSLFGLTFVPEESYSGRLRYNVVNTDSGVELYNQEADVVLTSSQEFTQWFQFPYEARLGENLRARLFKEDQSILMVRPENGDATRPYTTSHVRFFADDPVVVSGSAAEQLEAIVVGGEGINVSRSGNVLTISRTGNGGGTNPPAPGQRMYFGLSSEPDPASVDLSTLTRINNHTNPQLITLGTATQGQYGWIFTESAHDLTTINDTVLGQDVTDLFTETVNAQTIDSLSFDARRVGPLNAGFNEQYMVRF